MGIMVGQPYRTLNNDGILLYAGMAVLFVAQASGIELTLTQQLVAAAVCLVGLGGAERNWIRDHATDQPFATYTQPLRLRGTQAAPLPKVLISSSFPLDQVRELIKAGHPWFAPLAGPEWQLLELRTGHWPLASRPRDLADLLDQQVA